MVSYPHKQKDEKISYTSGGTEFEPSASIDSQNSGDGSDANSKKRKGRKKKVDQACVYCRRSHMICDDARPCLRCIKRGIGHLCHDEPTASRQKKKPDLGYSEKGEVLPDGSTPDSLRPNTTGPLADYVPVIVPNLPNNINLGNKNDQSLGLFRQGGPEQGQQDQGQGLDPTLNHGIKSHTSLTKSLQFNQEPFFYSEHAGSEFSSLNDFLSMIDDPELVNGALQDSTTLTDPLMGFLMSPERGNSTTNLNNLLQFSPAAPAQLPTFPDTQAKMYRSEAENGNSKGTASRNLSSNNLKDNHQPVISDSARDKFFLTAADPTTEISPEERLKQVIKAKLEAGLLQPYNYAKGYARLQSYMDNYMNQSSRQRIMKPLLIFRPAFRAIARTLKDVDLVLVEESFERVLLDYDRVFTSMAIPACLWRRTGEIYRGNKEFASLVGVSTDDLKDGKLAIYELMSEESAVNFWEKYGAIAFDKGQKAVLTSCNLRTKDGFKRKSCCFSFTIRRDRYNIPSCIVGNFIPIDP
ncbi:hypothetical protein PUMCH_000130 [Australozyma saopauloensis]|uniref:Zn(2)-C6 fungal-type domain-containing protein n=1 Tax=Australozyma saopauloensis TaxID=291208 RepID=A0AAX4H3B9_9ASCO|nr:hypothetical protein PUMCH_000130 [[Candida] saopauloensis]